jgi:hypothetical protein
MRALIDEAVAAGGRARAPRLVGGL